MPEQEEQNRILFEQNVGSIFINWSSERDKNFFDLILNQTRAMIKSLFTAYSMQEPIINILDVEEINAYAIKGGGRTFIAITPKIINNIHSYVEKLLTTKKLESELDIKQDDLSRLIVIFLIGHEAGHLILGHLGTQLHSVRAELGTYANMQPEVDSVVEEVAADRFGADFLFNYLKSSDINFDYFVTLTSSLLSMLSLFRILGGGGRWMDRFFDSTHPPSEYRSIAACSQFMANVQSLGGVDAEQIRLSAKNTFQIEHTAYMELSGEEVSVGQREQYAKLLKMEAIITKFVIERHHFLHPKNIPG